jgi:hypothetical protein
LEWGAQGRICGSKRDEVIRRGTTYNEELHNINFSRLYNQNEQVRTRGGASHVESKRRKRNKQDSAIIGFLDFVHRSEF